jgi:hypothetical protein
VRSRRRIHKKMLTAYFNAHNHLPGVNEENNENLNKGSHSLTSSKIGYLSNLNKINLQYLLQFSNFQ